MVLVKYANIIGCALLNQENITPNMVMSKRFPNDILLNEKSANL